MPDDVSRTLQEIMDLSDDTQASLGKRLGVSQSTIWRWLNHVNEPNKQEWDAITSLWMAMKGIKLTLNEKVAPFDLETQRLVHEIVDDYLKRIPRPTARPDDK